MNIISELLGSSGAGAVQGLASQFGLDEGSTQTAIASLLPAITGAMRNNAGNQGGIESLLSALGRGNHAQYLDDPGTLADSRTTEDGNNILGHLLGGKQASRDVASRAAEATGLDTGILKKMLPLVAALAMGSMGKKFAGQSAPQSSQPGQSNQSGDNLGDMVGSFLDFDGDGSISDDLIGLARKLF